MRQGIFIYNHVGFIESSFAHSHGIVPQYHERLALRVLDTNCKAKDLFAN